MVCKGGRNSSNKGIIAESALPTSGILFGIPSIPTFFLHPWSLVSSPDT